METDVKLADAYYRLSVEEANGSESSSITNQRSIVRQYCQDNGITIVKEFVDDGFSGSNFNRPGFQDLMKHIDTGLVNMVITKDLSRLGRDMTESSNYAETYFPEHGIHYIAISDNFDSNEVNLMAPFQFAMNDVYLRDTSRKIKQVLNQKRKKGEYCACPPFGYMKNPNDETKLIPDPQTAPIVQRIFELAVSGSSAHAIAIKITDEGLITPLKYRVLYRDKFSDVGAARATDTWNHTTVKRILKNPVYLGHTILGKHKKASLKSKKKIAVPKEEWSITKNTHPPLVTQKQFDKVEYYMGMHTKSWEENEWCRNSIFNGMIFCASCGAAMCSSGTVYKGERNKYWYLACNNIPKRSANHCEHGARIRYSDLMEIIKDELNQLINLSDNEISEIIKDALKNAGQENVYQNETQNLKAIQIRIEKIEKIIIKLYGDNASGIIDDEQLANMVKNLSKESKTLKEQYFRMNNEKSSGNDIIDSFDKFFKLAKSFTQIDNLTEDIVRTFITRIEIGKKEYSDDCKITNCNTPYKQSIKITYRFIGNINNKDYTFNNLLQNVQKIAI